VPERGYLMGGQSACKVGAMIRAIQFAESGFLGSSEAYAFAQCDSSGRLEACA